MIETKTKAHQRFCENQKAGDGVFVKVRVECLSSLSGIKSSTRVFHYWLELAIILAYPQRTHNLQSDLPLLQSNDEVEHLLFYYLS